MNTRALLICGAAMFLLYGCATQNTESPQMLDMANAEPAAPPAVNIDKPSTPDPTPPQMEAAKTETPAETTSEMKDCSTKGKRIMLDGRQIGVTIKMEYCSANLKPEGNPFWIPETEVPALGNIHVDDQCNISYCLTTPHYDYFGITNGENSIRVQVKWQNNEPVIY